MFSCKVGAEETLDRLPKKPFLNDVGLPSTSCDFEPCGGYPLEPRGWLCDPATFYQWSGPLMCLEYR
jgi:hypothetical protein